MRGAALSPVEVSDPRSWRTWGRASAQAAGGFHPLVLKLLAGDAQHHHWQVAGKIELGQLLATRIVDCRSQLGKRRRCLGAGWGPCWNLKQLLPWPALCRAGGS